MWTYKEEDILSATQRSCNCLSEWKIFQFFFFCIIIIVIIVNHTANLEYTRSSAIVEKLHNMMLYYLEISLGINIHKNKHPQEQEVALQIYIWHNIVYLTFFNLPRPATATATTTTTATA